MSSERSRAEQKPRSLFDLPADFFDSCRLLGAHQSEILPSFDSSAASSANDGGGGETEHEVLDQKGAERRGKESATRLTCNNCKSEFESLQDQRFHFKSDFHRLNVKLSIAGKSTVKEEDLYELGGNSFFEDIDVSSISGSEDEFEKGSIMNTVISEKEREGIKQKIYLSLHSGDKISVWRCLILSESEELLIENNELDHMGNSGDMPYVEEGELINRLKCLVREPRNKTQLRIVLLASGGHFAGCVFDGNFIIAHKTFHRYVVRAKAGKKQSSKDATGKSANSAGSSIRRYNEAALKKEIQELLVTWKPHIDSALCIFIYAPSKNRQLLFDGEKKPPGYVIRHIPLTVRRPTLKEAKRVYNHMTHMTYEVHEKASLEEDSRSYASNEGNGNALSNEAHVVKHVEVKESSSGSGPGSECLLSNVENISSSPDGNEVTPLHEAAKSGDVQRTLELLEEGLNPCIKDSRGRTPYMLATDKEVRNTFRRFMALNLDKWDWHVANVPSPLTKDMEDSQSAKQAEKDAKKKAKAKELKKLRKAKEKAKAEAAASQNAFAAAPQAHAPVSAPALRQRPSSAISKEEEERRALAAEREKRAAAAERRIAAGSGANNNGSCCCCCNASLVGKVPFHRYNYNYCSTSCMFVHKQMLEDDG